MITYLQALILGLFQGVTELFPVSSLGHSVLIAYLFNWTNILNGTVNKASNFLLFLVVIHVATALALLFFYRKTWWKLIKAWFKSIATRSMEQREAKLAWLLIAATIPAGLIALAFQTKLQDQFAKPLSAVIFITLLTALSYSSATSILETTSSFAWSSLPGYAMAVIKFSLASG